MFDNVISVPPRTGVRVNLKDDWILEIRDLNDWFQIWWSIRDKKVKSFEEIIKKFFNVRPQLYLTVYKGKPGVDAIYKEPTYEHMLIAFEEALKNCRKKGYDYIKCEPIENKGQFPFSLLTSF